MTMEGVQPLPPAQAVEQYNILVIVGSVLDTYKCVSYVRRWVTLQRFAMEDKVTNHCHPGHSNTSGFKSEDM